MQDIRFDFTVTQLANGFGRDRITSPWLKPLAMLTKNLKYSTRF
jgi:hypothetical protein